jgi:hypothetical protein
MGIATLGGSSGLTTSDLVAYPGYTLINSWNGSSATTVTFSDIPQTYRGIKLVYTSLELSTTYLRLRPNNNTGSLYAFASHTIANGQTGGYNASTNDSIHLNVFNTTNLAGFIEFQNYTSTTAYKSFSSEAAYFSSGYGYCRDVMTGVFGSTSAITSLTIFPNSSNIQESGTASGIYLFGLK